jgi:hypothetical protein
MGAIMPGDASAMVRAHLLRLTRAREGGKWAFFRDGCLPVRAILDAPSDSCHAIAGTREGDLPNN